MTLFSLKRPWTHHESITEAMTDAAPAGSMTEASYRRFSRESSVILETGNLIIPFLPTYLKGNETQLLQVYGDSYYKYEGLEQRM